jgi:hypothetical protein
VAAGSIGAAVDDVVGQAFAWLESVAVPAVLSLPAIGLLWSH